MHLLPNRCDRLTIFIRRHPLKVSLLSFAVALASSMALYYERQVAVLISQVEQSASSTLSLEALAIHYQPRRFMSADIVSAGDKRDLAGSKLRLPIGPGEVLRHSHLHRSTWRPSDAIPVDKRLISVEITNLGSLARNLSVDDRIDLIWHVKQLNSSRTYPLLASVRLFQAPDLESGWISLLVSPADALRIQHAQLNGELMLSARNRSQTQRVQPQPLSSRALIKQLARTPPTESVPIHYGRGNRER